MRMKQNALLAGVAALALMAGGGIAAAQQSPQGQTGGAGAGMSDQSSTHAHTAKPNAGAGMEQHAQGSAKTGGTGSTAQNTEGSKNKQPSMAEQSTKGAKAGNRSAEMNEKKADQNANKSAQNAKSKGEAKQRIGENGKNKGDANRRFGENAKNKGEANQRFGENAKGKGEAHERFGRTESNRNEQFGKNERSEHNRGRTAERNGQFKGLEGNASIPMQGSHVNLSSEQRTKIRDTVIDARNAPRVGHVDFDVRVGTLVPRERVHVVPVPETLVRIDPQWRGYDYFVVEDQVIIVNPRDMRIVAVIDV